MVCPKCRWEVQENEKFCTKCGTKSKSRVSLILPIISIILSVIGIIGPWILHGLSSGFARFQVFLIFASAIILSFVGIIIALVAQNKQKSLLGFLAGLIPCVYYIAGILFTMMRNWR